MSTWLERLHELTQANAVAIERARSIGGVEDWERAAAAAAEVNELLRRYRASGAPGFDAQIPADTDPFVRAEK